MDTIKERSGRDLVEAEEIKKRWKEYRHRKLHTHTHTQDINEPDKHDDVVSYPEPDILECEVNWALGITAVSKASGCNGITVELFKTLNDDTIKVLHSLHQQIWKTQQWPQDWKTSILISIPKKGSTKECSDHQTIALTSHARKVMLKILHAWLQHYRNQELLDFQAGFRKGRGTRIKVANICWIIEKAKEFQKTIYLCLINYAKTFKCVGHNKLWKTLNEMKLPDYLTCLLGNMYVGQEAAVRTLYGTTDWFRIKKGVQQGYLL